MSPLRETSELLAALSPLLEVVEASGFVRQEGHQQPTWTRAREVEDETPQAWVEKVVIWRHPRQAHLHGYVATTRSDAMVHWRLFDPEWQPAQVLPGYFEKGWAFEDADKAREIATELARIVWPRALIWFDEPVDPDELMLAAGRIPSAVLPGPMLERHRHRAAWLEEHGETQEAAYVRGVVAELEALFAQAERAREEGT